MTNKRRRHLENGKEKHKSLVESLAFSVYLFLLSPLSLTLKSCFDVFLHPFGYFKNDE